MQNLWICSELEGGVKAFVCWSGGKESSLSLYKATQNLDVEVVYLLNMISEDGKRSRSHGVSSNLLKVQAEAMGIPIIQRRTTWEIYEEEFKRVISDFKKEGIQVGIFGDIDLEEHRDWVERVCKEAKIKPTLPLWKRKRKELLEEFIQASFKAIVVATQADFLGKEWLGRQINEEFVRDLKALVDIDLCGESGEYHTFVYDGPIFKKAVEFIEDEKILENKHWFLKLKLKENDFFCF